MKDISTSQWPDKPTSAPGAGWVTWYSLTSACRTPRVILCWVRVGSTSTHRSSEQPFPLPTAYQNRSATQCRKPTGCLYCVCEEWNLTPRLGRIILRLQLICFLRFSSGKKTFLTLTALWDTNWRGWSSMSCFFFPSNWENIFVEMASPCYSIEQFGLLRFFFLLLM